METHATFVLETLASILHKKFDVQHHECVSLKGRCNE